MPDRTCSIDACEKQVFSRGWCHMHWNRWRRHGDPLARKYLESTPENFWLRTEAQGACVVWTGGTRKDGYGQVTWHGEKVLAHRLAFFLRLGRWPESDLLRHLCNNPTCVLHAVEGTRSENMLDAVAAGVHPQARKTHCKNGHEFTSENTYRYRGGRQCRACARVWKARSRAASPHWEAS